MIVIESPKPKYSDLELIPFACRQCGTVHLDVTDAELIMWGLGAFAYKTVCTKCKQEIWHEVPLRDDEVNLFRYLKELRQLYEKGVS